MRILFFGNKIYFEAPHATKSDTIWFKHTNKHGNIKFEKRSKGEMLLMHTFGDKKGLIITLCGSFHSVKIIDKTEERFCNFCNEIACSTYGCNKCDMDACNNCVDHLKTISLGTVSKHNKKLAKRTLDPTTNPTVDSTVVSTSEPRSKKLKSPPFESPPFESPPFESPPFESLPFKTFTSPTTAGKQFKYRMPYSMEYANRVPYGDSGFGSVCDPYKREPYLDEYGRAVPVFKPNSSSEYKRVLPVLSPSEQATNVITGHLFLN